MKKLILNRENVKLQVEASDWEEAIKVATGILVQQGCAKQSYVDSIIKAVKKMGPYIVISEGFAIPHARPEEGAISIGCSLVTLKKPVFFEGDTNPVKVLIAFSAVDSDSHIEILKMIVEFVERDLIDDISKAKSYEELLKIINM